MNKFSKVKDLVMFREVLRQRQFCRRYPGKKRDAGVEKPGAGPKKRSTGYEKYHFGRL